MNNKKVCLELSFVALVVIFGVVAVSTTVSANQTVTTAAAVPTTIQDLWGNAQDGHKKLGPWSFNGTLDAPDSDLLKFNFQNRDFAQTDIGNVPVLNGDFKPNLRDMLNAQTNSLSDTLGLTQSQISWPSRAPVGSSGEIYNVPGDYASIQDAIDNATGGETILVEPGRYNETVDVTVSHIVIKANSTNPADTIVSANGTDDHVVSITNRTNVTLKGFTIQDARGTSQDVAGIYMNTTGDCTITNTVIMNISTAGGYDAYGLLVETAINLTSTDTTVRDIHGNNNSIGILMEEGMNIDFDPTVTENVTASNGAAFGLLIEAINLSVTDTAIHNIIGNSSAYGILLFAENAGFNHTVIERVNASNGMAYGIYAEYILNGSFTDTNISDITGNNGAFGVYMVVAENVSFELTVIEQFTASNGSAGGIVMAITNGSFINTTIRDIAGNPGASGVYMWAENVSFDHTVIERVTQTHPDGAVGGIYAEYILNGCFTDTTISDITGNNSAFGVYMVVAENMSFDPTVIELVNASDGAAYGIYAEYILNGSFFDTVVNNITGNSSAYGIYMAAENVSFDLTVIELVNAPNGVACGITASIQNDSFTDTAIRDITGNSSAYGISLFAENVIFSMTLIELVNASDGAAYGIYAEYILNGSFTDTNISDITGNNSAFGIWMNTENVSFDHTVIKRVTAQNGSALGIFTGMINDSFTDTVVNNITGNSSAYGIWMVAENVSFSNTTVHNITGNITDDYDAIGVFIGYMINGSFTDTTVSDIDGNDFAIGIFGYLGFRNVSFSDTTIRDINGNGVATGFVILPGIGTVNFTFDYTVIERVSAHSAQAAGFLINEHITDGSFSDTTIRDIAGNTSAWGILMSAENVSFDLTVIERVNASNGEGGGIVGVIQNSSFTDTTISDIAGNSSTPGYLVKCHVAAIAGVAINNTKFSGGEITNCGHGIWLDYGNGNRIEGFIIRDNTLFDTGVHLETNTSNITVWRNCFYNNVLQAWDNGTNNSWDGNYWEPPPGIMDDYAIPGSAGSRDNNPLQYCPMCAVEAPVVTPIGLIALVGLLATLAAVTITKRKRR